MISLFKKRTPKPQIDTPEVCENDLAENHITFDTSYLESNKSEFKEFIKTLKYTVGVSSSQFNELYLQPVYRFIEFCHGLPATPHEHHFNRNGLISHSLTTALFCVRSSDGRIFSANTPSEMREESEIRWRYTAFLAGLYCDLRHVQKLIVKSNNKQWNPLLMGITQWARENNIKTCSYEWKPEIDVNTDFFSAVYASKLISPESEKHLTKYDHTIFDLLLMVLAGKLNEHDHVLAELVITARETSITKDYSSRATAGGNGNLAVPNTDILVVDAIRRLFKKEWTLNNTGSVAWYTDDGLFLVWSRAAKDIIRTLTDDRIFNIPRDPNSLAELLLNRGMIERGSVKDLYWEFIAPQGKKTVAYQTVKITDPDSAFLSIKDKPLPVKLKFTDEQTTNQGDLLSNLPKQTSEDHESPSRPASTGNPNGEKQKVESPKPPSKEKKQKPSPKQPDDWFARHGKLGSLLKSIHEELANKVLEVGKDVLWIDGGLAIVYPEIIQSYGVDAKEVVKEMNTMGWIAKDPQQPTAALRKIDLGGKDVKVAVLTEEVGVRVLNRP